VRIPRRAAVADVMTTEVVSVPPTLPVREVASTLFSAEVRAVPVLDDGDDLPR
jgi:CBS domain-containing protein